MERVTHIDADGARPFSLNLPATNCGCEQVKDRIESVEPDSLRAVADLRPGRPRPGRAIAIRIPAPFAV